MLRLNKHTVMNSLLLTIVFVSFSIFSTAKGTEELAKKLFEEGKYGEALPYFKELNVLYPNDEPFQYYYGACLTQTGNYSLKTRKLLLQASQGNVPTNVFFYIGENYHALNDFETAKTYYQRFAEYARKKELKAVNFDKIVEQCNTGVNPFATTSTLSTTQETQAEEPAITQPTNPTHSVDSVYSIHSVDSVYSVDSVDSVHSEIIPADTNRIEPLIVAQPIETTSKYTLQNNDTIPTSSAPITFATDTAKQVKPIEPEESYVEQIQVPSELLDTTFNFTLTSTIHYQIIGQFKTDTGKANNLVMNG